MALHADFAVKTAANHNHTTFSCTIGDFKAYFLRIAVNFLNDTGYRAFYNASQHPFLIHRALFTCYDLPVHAKEEDSSSNVVPGTAKLRNLYFESEDGIVDVHPLINTVQEFSARLQTFTAKRHLYCDSRRNFASTVYPCLHTHQLYWDKVQTFTARAQIFGAKVQNDDAIVKNAGNRSYRLCSKRQPFTFSNQMVCAITYPFSRSF